MRELLGDAANGSCQKKSIDYWYLTSIDCDGSLQLEIFLPKYDANVNLDDKGINI